MTIILRMALNLLGIKAVPLETLPESGFMPSVERCRHLITSKTRAIVLVTPNNPVSSPSHSKQQIHVIYNFTIDRRHLLAIVDFIIRRASSREKPGSHSRRNLPRFSHHHQQQLSSSPSLHIRLLAFHFHSPLLILQIILSARAPTRCYSRLPFPSHNLS